MRTVDTMLHAYMELTQAMGLGPPTELIGVPDETESESNLAELLKVMLDRSKERRDMLTKQIENVTQRFFPE